MYELTFNEVENVSGGFHPPTITPFTSARLAMATFPGWTAVSAAFTGGYAAGTYLYNNFISDWLWN